MIAHNLADHVTKERDSGTNPKAHNVKIKLFLHITALKQLGAEDISVERVKKRSGTYMDEEAAETLPFWVAMEAVLSQRDHFNPPELFSSSHGLIVREPGPA
uniref:Uncharacterized protein n=1 Tax=Timema poppense TaxID=170557 RepID=A0A7R9DGU7_TIMPO|nr:unnamed protein product [Timema poppensis]